MARHSRIGKTAIRHLLATVCRLSHWGRRIATVRHDPSIRMESRGVGDGMPGVCRGMRQGTRVSSKGCIVIVEPDDLIRVLVERWLDEAGFQACPVFKDHALPVVMPRLVITD